MEGLEAVAQGLGGPTRVAAVVVSSKSLSPRVRAFAARAAVFALRSATDIYATAAPPQDREPLGAVRQSQRWVEEALRAMQRVSGPRSDEPVGGQ